MKKTIKLKIVAVVIALLLTIPMCLVIFSSCGAPELDPEPQDTETKKPETNTPDAETDEQVQNLIDELNQTKEDKTKVENNLKEAENKLNEANKNLEEVRKKADATEEELNNAKKEVAEAQKDVDKYVDTLAKKDEEIVLLREKLKEFDLRSKLIKTVEDIGLTIFDTKDGLFYEYELDIHLSGYIENDIDPYNPDWEMTFIDLDENGEKIDDKERIEEAEKLAELYTEVYGVHHIEYKDIDYSAIIADAREQYKELEILANEVSYQIGRLSHDLNIVEKYGPDAKDLEAIEKIPDLINDFEDKNGEYFGGLEKYTYYQAFLKVINK